MADLHKNFAISAVATAPSPAVSGTSLVVTAGHGARFPTVPFNATIWPTAAQPDPSNAEIVRVTAITTDTLTITRAQEGTTARTVIVGDQIAAGITAKTLTDVEAYVSVFGDGSDGDVTVATTVTLTRDMQYNNLTVTSAGRIKTSGWRVFVKGTLTVDASGAVDADGEPASGNIASGYTGTNNTSLGRGAGSNNATVNTVGTAGNAVIGSNDIFAGTAGAGGASGTGNAGGAAGGRVTTTLGTNLPKPTRVPEAVTGFSPTGTNVGGTAGYQGSASGGNGGGSASAAAGAGGGGGGILLVAARAIANSGRLSANGGAGGFRASGDAGGGGGGGGGVVIVSCATFTGTDPTSSAGTGGAGIGLGVAGANGTAGTVFKNVWG